MTLNMGRSTVHARRAAMILELDGETVVKASCDIGYLHTGIEKEFEQKNWQQAVTLTDRIDYLCPLTTTCATRWR